MYMSLPRIAVMLLSATFLHAQQTITYTSASRGRTYTITTQGIGQVISFPNHWTYQPSVILPSALTNNQYVLLFSSNLSGGQGGTSGEAIFMSTSPNGYSMFTTPQIILTNTSVGNICDFIDARPIYFNSQWWVMVQAEPGNYQSGCNFPSSTNPSGTSAVSFVARGASLNSLSWIVDGNNNAVPILQSGGSCAPYAGACGIGEQLQWFNTAPYGGYQPTPVLAVFNDWNYSIAAQEFAYLSPDASYTWNYWYNVLPAYAPANDCSDTAHCAGVANPYRGIREYPDGILAQSLDAATKDNPGMAIADGCDSRNGAYEYGTGIGFFPDPSPYPNGPVQDGIAVFGAVDSAVNDTYGPRMFRARLARDAYGFLPPVNPNAYPRQWQTYVYYNAAQVSIHNNCDYSNWNSSGQGFWVSSVTITEQ